MDDVSGSLIVVLYDEMADLRRLRRALTRAGYDDALASSNPTSGGSVLVA